MCFVHGCPEVVAATDCWCWEHLAHCDEIGCDHGAHWCEAPIHYCDDHQPA